MSKHSHLTLVSPDNIDLAAINEFLRGNPVFFRITAEGQKIEQEGLLKIVIDVDHQDKGYGIRLLPTIPGQPYTLLDGYIVHLTFLDQIGNPVSTRISHGEAVFYLRDISSRYVISLGHRNEPL